MSDYASRKLREWADPLLEEQIRLMIREMLLEIEAHLVYMATGRLD